MPIEELPPQKLTTVDELAGEVTPTGYDQFVELVEALLDTNSGVWTKLIEMLVCGEKSSKSTLVINIYTYNNGGLAKKLSVTTTKRWFLKAASELGLQATRVAFGKGLSIKVRHRPSKLDESKIRELWSKLNGS